MNMPMRLEKSSANHEIVDLESYKSTKDLDKVLAWVNQEHTRAKNARTLIERQWYMNLAFYFGQQNVQFASVPIDAGGGFRLTIPKAPAWRVRLISNKIRPIIRTELSKLTSQKPTAFIIPASSDDTDINAARAGELIWESLYSRKKISQVIRKALFWTCITGTGFIKDYWDDLAIDPSSDLMGDIIYEPLNPFSIFVPDLVEEEIESQPFVIHASAKSPEWVSLRYKKGLNNKPLNPNVTKANDVLDSGFLKLVGATNNQKDSVLCLEVWVKPGATKMFPEGATVTIVGDTVVQIVRGVMYPHREFPFSKIDHIPSGKFYADSVVTDLIPLQKEYNRTRSQIIEAKNMTAKPQLMAPRGSIDPRKVTTEPGQVILYTPGFAPPTPLPLQGLPNYVLQELDRINSDMEDISGQHEVTKGNAPPGVTAATAITFLQEQDDSKLSHTVESIEAAVEKIGRHSLSLVGQYWDTQRVVKVAGREHMFDSEVLKGADLNGNTDIRVEGGSALPQSKAAKQAFIMDLMKMGFVDPSKGLSVLEMGGIDKLYESIEIDQRHAQRENVRMQAGQQVQVNTWDEHAVHVSMHDRFRKSQVFEGLDETAKAIFEAHVQMHKQVLMTGMLPPELGGDPTMAGGQPPEMGGPQGGPPNPGNAPSETAPPEMMPPEGGIG